MRAQIALLTAAGEQNIAIAPQLKIGRVQVKVDPFVKTNLSKV